MNSGDDTLPSSGPTIRRAFEALVTTLNERGARYAIIGGIATIQYTRVRTTDDIDVLLTVPQVSLPGLLDALRERGFAVDVARNVRELRDGGLTTLRFADVVVDLMRPVLPAYAHVLERAVTARVYGHAVRMSAAEGLVVMKLLAMRPQDETDIQDLLAAHAGRLDLDHVRAELGAILEPSDPRWAKLEDWTRRASASP